MNSLQPARPLVFLYFFRLFALLGFAPFLVNTVDILLHLSAPNLDPTFTPGMRFLLGLVVAPLILVIAGLCIRRAPGNLIGWSLVMFAYGASVQVMRAGLLPPGTEILIANFVIGAFWFAFLLIPLYYPDGQLYPARANRWGNSLVSVIFFSSLVISNLCNPQLIWGSGANQLQVPNPLLVFAWDYRVVTIPMIVSLLIAGIVTVILRYRGSRELGRLQLRWLLFGVLLQGMLTILTFWVPPGLERISTWINLLFGLIIPLAIGIAILRYRLYDIDLIIRRTLQYSTMTAVLGLVFFGGVLLLQQLFRVFTGQESDAALVLSTLAIIVLFTPLRKQLQAGIDRRFYRAKYDARQTVAAFSFAARSQVEVETLAQGLAATAQEALQPEGVWVWLRSDLKRERREE